jgi:hypothetical protein
MDGDIQQRAKPDRRKRLIAAVLFFLAIPAAFIWLVLLIDKTPFLSDYFLAKSNLDSLPWKLASNTLCLGVSFALARLFYRTTNQIVQAGIILSVLLAYAFLAYAAIKVYG